MHDRELRERPVLLLAELYWGLRVVRGLGARGDLHEHVHGGAVLRRDHLRGLEGDGRGL